MSNYSPLSDQAIEEKRLRLRRDAEAKSAAAAEAAGAAAAAHAKLLDFERQVAELLRVQQRLAAELGDVAEASPPLVTSNSMAPANTGVIPSDNASSASSTGMTFASLIDLYVTDQRSPYKNLRFSTRTHYDRLMKRIREDCGQWKLTSVTRQKIDDVYDLWTEGRTKKKAMGHALITMVRMLANFGFKQLDDGVCKDLAFTLHSMQFPAVESRTEELTAANADAIIKTAHEFGRPSIALAQAIQFDCRQLSQKDVIGEWVPITERGPLTDIVNDTHKWVRGLRWDELDQNLVLRHLSSADDETIEIKFQDYPRVMNEIAVVKDRQPWKMLPKNGPMILCESTNRPWVPGEFRRWWRKLANECGIPENVKNSDSRPSMPRRETRYRKKKAGG